MKSIMSFCFWVLVFVSGTALGADANGYTAKYECISGGANCNVDVATLTTTACDATYSVDNGGTTITAWSQINQNLTYICLLNDDYTSLGTLTLTTSGTSGTRKVLRYTRTGDNGDEPWNQSGANQTQVAGLTVTAEYWIIHRITFTSNITISDTKSNNIFNRIWGNQAGIYLGEDNNNNTLQNSVLNDVSRAGISDIHGVGVAYNSSGGSVGHRIVNNEIFDWKGDAIQRIQVNIATYDLIIENNDLYITSALYTGGGATACAENGIDLKHGGTSTGPIKIIHNRFWGFRLTDGSCADGSFGEAMIFHETNGASDHNSYGLAQNNIFMDGTICLTSPNSEAGGPDHWSIIGNICYDMSGVGSGTQAIGIAGNTTEMYLNTSINVFQGASDGWLEYQLGATNDIRCNVNINAGNASTFSSGTSTEIDYNVYYNTTTEGEANVIGNLTLNTRANSTAYAADTIMRTTATPPADGTAGDFLWKCLNCNGALTTAASPPTFCTRLNCQTKDGSVWWKAIRGPLVWKRKLQTVSGGETFYIPYARTKNDSNLPEFNFCQSNFADRTGIGINDATGFSSFSPDIRGVAR